MEEGKLEHRIIYTETKLSGDVLETCLCGASWTHPKNKSSYEQREAIFESHVKYKRPLTKPD